jgi:hypothetical protein
MQVATRVIDLRIVAENDSDSFKTILSEVPFSTQLSMYQVPLKKNSFGLGLRENLLQITVSDRTIVFDINHSTLDRNP